MEGDGGCYTFYPLPRCCGPGTAARPPGIIALLSPHSPGLWGLARVELPELPTSSLAAGSGRVLQSSG
jgi:hypothetical protein